MMAEENKVQHSYDVVPIYIPGLFLTASNPSNTWISDSS